MSIQTIEAEVLRVGSTVANLVECVDEHDDERTVDYEVACDALGCERYACTHLSLDEAIIEVHDHARSAHGTVTS